MALLMSEIKNPFLKDYSTTSLLKKNYGVLLIQSQVKQNNQNFNHQYKKQPHPYKQNLPTSSSISSPFFNKSINAYELLSQKRNPHNLRNSEVRSLSQNRSMFGSLEKNIFYKGLEDLGTKQIMKNEMERQAREQLKYYGVDALRYQYVPVEYSTGRYEQERQNHYAVGDNRGSSKLLDSQKNIEKPKWNVNIITSQYYGYDGIKEKKQDDDFPIQKTKKTSFKASTKDMADRNKRHSYYDNIIANIPQDRNQDFETAHHIKLKPNNHQQQQFLKSSLPHIPSIKRLSVDNYSQNFHPQSSASSEFGYSSEIYDSGANFMAKFGKNKGGPLDTNAFDNEKEDGEQFDLDQFDDIGKRSSIRQYTDTLEHNNKIYYKIPL